MVLNDPVVAASVTRFSILTLWHSITPNPVVDTPQAVCDARTVGDALIASELRSLHRIGEIYLATYRPDHAWSYFSVFEAIHEVRPEVDRDMRPDRCRRVPPVLASGWQRIWAPHRHRAIPGTVGPTAIARRTRASGRSKIGPVKTTVGGR